MSMKGNVPVDPSVGGRTRQEAKNECDVNLIVAHHKRGGITAHVINKVAAYGFAPATSFRDCMEEVRNAEEAFAALPAATREYFHNDPARFVEYAADKADLAKLVELGLIVQPEAAPSSGAPGSAPAQPAG